jgi:DNA-binding beta-propeller fold protein YncE
VRKPLPVRLTVVTVVLPLATLLGSLPAAPQGHAKKDLIAVSLSGENLVVFVDPDTGRKIGKATTGPGPHELIAAPDGSRVYVADAGASSGDARGQTISVIDPRAGTTLARYTLGNHRSPHDVRVSRDGSLVWVAVAPSRAVLEVNTRTGDIVRTWPTEVDGGWFVAVTPDDRKIYVPHLEGKSVTAFDRATGRRTTVLSGGAQSGIDISPDGRHVWVIDHERQRINVVSVATDAVVGHVPLPSNAFGRLRFVPDGRRVVVVQGRRLSTIDPVALVETGSVEMPLDGKVVAVSPDGRRAAVSNPAADKITLLDVPAMRVIASYPVGKTPDGISWIRVSDR